METKIYEKTSIVSASAQRVYDWHQRPFAFERIMPHWESTTCEKSIHDFKNGATCGFSFKLGPIRFKWKARYSDVIEGLQFVDTQEKGPFPTWRHTHRFEPIPGGKTKIIDRVEYALPFGKLGDWIAGAYARRRLEKMFERRHFILRREFSKPEGRIQKILVSGATGLIGNTLIPLLTTGGHDVHRLVRKHPRHPNEIYWNPEKGVLDGEALEGFDAIIHLAGESVMGRWTRKKKASIYESRIKGTNLLVKACEGLKRKPEVFISASAIGYYASSGDTPIHEASPSGQGFLSNVCADWEKASHGLSSLGIRTAYMRIGIVLSPKGGALKQMLPPFLMGLGGNIGRGDQYMSWVSIDDVAGIIEHTLLNPTVKGPVNVVSPEPVRNSEFTTTLAKTLRRPAFLPLPSFVVRLIFGELGDELLLSSLKVVPEKLRATGYEFIHPKLDHALQDLLGSAREKTDDPVHAPNPTLMR